MNFIVEKFFRDVKFFRFVTIIELDIVKFSKNRDDNENSCYANARYHLMETFYYSWLTK